MNQYRARIEGLLHPYHSHGHWHLVPDIVLNAAAKCYRLPEFVAYLEKLPEKIAKAEAKAA